MSCTQAREHLALALDLPLPAAKELYQAVSPHVGYVKIGLSLFVEHGPAAVDAFAAMGAKVFLDLKLHDIPNTVELAATWAAQIGAGLITVHAQGGRAMIEAACAGARAGANTRHLKAPKVLAVTVLTSLKATDLQQIGYAHNVPALVERLGRLAIEAGADGLVCSANEAGALRSALGKKVFLCTPGVRMASDPLHDQARVQSPRFAIERGADLLVVGRPIYESPDPSAAAQAICSEIANALATSAVS